MIRSMKRKPSILRPNSRRNRNDARSIRFLEFVKLLPCCITHKAAWDWALAQNDGGYGLISMMGNTNIFPEQIEAAHINGNAAAKSSNYTAIPLTQWHHRGESCTKKNPYCQEILKREFGEFHGIDIEAIQRLINQAFDELEKP